MPLRLVAIERASGSVNEICWSKAFSIWCRRLQNPILLSPTLQRRRRQPEPDCPPRRSRSKHSGSSMSWARSRPSTKCFTVVPPNPPGKLPDLASSHRLGRTSAFRSEGGKVRNRPVSPVAAHSGDGLLSDTQRALSLCRGNRSSCPTADLRPLSNRVGEEAD